MITLIVKLDIHPQHFDEFMASTRLAKSNVLLYEKGCLIYTINEDPDKLHGVILIEVYINKHALEVHKATPHFTNWRSKTGDMIASKKVTQYQSI